ncbi:hypothetical protein ACFVUW_10965 [Streptomyces xiamenensis]|uniref:hypothetical protein n=1 Tax=Streptomyces xiamenensis TaxID=408015 RepID=UPI0036E97D0B
MREDETVVTGVTLKDGEGSSDDSLPLSETATLEERSRLVPQEGPEEVAARLELAERMGQGKGELARSL